MKLLRVFTGLTLALCAALASCSNNNDNPTTPGDTTAPSRVTDLSIVLTSGPSLTLQWTAPGDDGHTGKAQSYQIRRSATAIDGSNFASATAIVNPPAPKAAGTVQQFVVVGIDTTVVTHFALRARDEAGNYSQVSNDAVFSPTGDAVPPAQITDLTVVSAGNNSLTIQWTAPGDNGTTGTASSYEVRWSASVINAGNFASATLAAGPPAPLVAGTVQQFTVTGLDTTLVTHFAMIAKDEVPNVSPVSNDAVWSPTFEATPPAQITNLAVVSAGNNSLTLQWTAPGDDGNSGTASSYEVRWSPSVINAGNFAAATLVAGPPAPLVAGTVQQFTVTGLDTTLVTHFAMIAKDEVPNVSPVSNDAVWSPAVVQQHLVKVIPPFKDNTMYEEDGDLSNGQFPYVFTGRTLGSLSTLSRRALLAFAISDSLPAGAVIDSVQLTMHVSKERTNAQRATSLHRVTADWGEGTSNSGGGGGSGGAATTNDATWVYRFWNTVMWSTPGGDFAAGASATTNIGAIGFYMWKSTQMKTDVQAWLDTPAGNFGWVMIGDEATTGSAKRLDSRENIPANRPKLKVFYTIP